MVQSSYPNKTAMAAALDIYLDAMRQFVVRCMRRIPRKQLQDAIAEVLSDRRREEFAQSLARGETVAGSIEFSDFPHLVNRRWREAFAEAFNNERGALNQLWLVLTSAVAGRIKRSGTPTSGKSPGSLSSWERRIRQGWLRQNRHSVPTGRMLPIAFLITSRALASFDID